jgi:hypothetical protein
MYYVLRATHCSICNGIMHYWLSWLPWLLALLIMPAVAHRPRAYRPVRLAEVPQLHTPRTAYLISDILCLELLAADCKAACCSMLPIACCCCCRLACAAAGSWLLRCWLLQGADQVPSCVTAYAVLLITSLVLLPLAALGLALASAAGYKS